jgi:CII-binding regulator of phage lambda lysogenization HflD
LDKIKSLTKQNNQVTYLLQVLFLEKKIESLHITRSMQDRAKQLSDEIDDANKHIQLIAKTSNLSLQLYSWYIQHGHARDEEDRITLDTLMQDPVLEEVKAATGFYERLYRYQCHCWYGFITQDFLMHYRYAQKWVDLFEKEEGMKQIESAQYIKGLHNLISAHFDLKNFDKFKETICLLEQFSETPIVLNNKNNLIQSFVYLYIAKINQHFLEGTFSEGLNMIPAMEEKLKEVELYIDSHRVLVFYYKIASLYFGAGNPEKSIDYLNRIINWKVNLRDDLQCYARLLHLIAHYEMGNMEVVAYLSKSVFRFMSKMKNLGAVEEVLFNFIKTSIQSGSEASFETLLEKLQPLEKNKLESRAFMYLDIISWLESKIQNTAVQTIIREKFEHAKKQRP